MYLSSEQYWPTVKANPGENQIESCGLCKPSSESLVHTNIYALDINIQAVIHGYSPDIWNITHALNLPHISAYSTVKKAQAVEQLFQSIEIQQSS